MVNLYIPSFQHDQFIREAEFVIKAFYQTKYIKLFIKNNGVFEFYDFEIMPYSCPYCFCKCNCYHSDHLEEYALYCLDLILEDDWKKDLLLVYFKDFGFYYFLKWIAQYINFNISRFESFDIFTF
jgi:hypothetical protein